MPIKPHKNETQSEFMGRCIPTELEGGAASSQAQAVTFCSRAWNERNDADDTPASAVRYDYADYPRMTRTQEGYLTGNAKVARIGVQSYRRADGSLCREYRPAESVFSKKSIDSFKMAPVTFAHPSERLVDASNAKRLAVGHIGENIYVDGAWLVMPITITDADTIARIEAGEALQLSAGYLAKVDEQPGEYNGEIYDAVQREIVGNHVAIVEAARAGSEARLNLDAADAVAVADHHKGEPRMSEKQVTVRVDGIEYSVPPEVERHMAKLDEAKVEADKALESVKADADAKASEIEASKAKLDEAAAEIEKLKAAHSDGAIREAVKARIDLERKALTVLDAKAAEGIADMTTRQIHEAVVKSVHTDADMTDKSDVYVAARFDAVLDLADVKGDAMSKQRLALDGGKFSATTKPLNADQARNDAWDSIKNAYKGEPAKA